MKTRFEILLFCLFSVTIVTLSVSNDVVLSPAREITLLRPTSRKPLSLSPSPKPNVDLVAAPNGTVYLIDIDNRKVIWSFPSGPPIYKSYQTPSLDDDKSVGHNRFSFFDYGDDGELYLHNNYGKLKLEGTIHDYVKKTPIYEDDEVTVGSMHSTVFKVDPWTGRLIHEYGKSLPLLQPKDANTSSIKGRSEKESSGSSSVKGSDVELYIERIDYSLSTKAFDKLLWNLSIGFFKAKVRCKGIDQLLDGASLNLGHKLGSSSDVPRIVSLPCEFEFSVRHMYKQSMFEHFLRLDINGLPDSVNGDNMLRARAPNHMLPSQQKGDEFAAVHQKGKPSSTHSHIHPSREALETDKGTHGRMEFLRLFVRRYTPWTVLFFAVLLIGFAAHHKFALAKGKSELDVESSLSSRPNSSRRKKSRKSGKNTTVPEDGLAVKRLLDLNSMMHYETDGRTIGKLFLSNREIAKGSNGTVVYEGIYEGRKVAVKRLVQAHHDVAFKEIQNLIASDQHPNIVRWYGMENDSDFVYISLELCFCSLNDLVESYADSSHQSHRSNSYDKSLHARTDYKVRLNSVQVDLQNIKLCKSNGHPSALLLKLMRDVVSGLVHLHELGIVHRDLKPQNVLINKDKTLCAKLSDMGISKRLLADMSSLGNFATGHGSSGWQPPEQLLHGRQTRAVDIFSLGCVLFFCVTGGRHPFGGRFERDLKIINNDMDLSPVENMPEALELFSRLLHPDPEKRPKAFEVLLHPFFWNSEMRLSFLHDASDRVELEDREFNSDILKALEGVAPTAIGTKWNEKLESQFIDNIGRYRRYKYDSIRDLLRVMRNKLNHYRELPADIQGLLGPVPDGFDEYFSNRFPWLLIEVYKVLYYFCRSEPWFQKYVQGSVV